MENAGSGPRDGQFSQGSAGPGLARGLCRSGRSSGSSPCSMIVTYSRIAAGRALPREPRRARGRPEPRPRLHELPDRADGDRGPRARRRTDRNGLVRARPARALRSSIVVPGVVDEGDLDAKWINVVPALGVAIVLVLTLRVRRSAAGVTRAETGSESPSRVVLGVLALPWIFAVARLLHPRARLPRAPARTRATRRSISASTTGFEGYLLVLTALAPLAAAPEHAPHPTCRSPCTSR